MSTLPPGRIMWTATLAAYTFDEQIEAAEALGYHLMSIPVWTVAGAEEAGRRPAELAQKAADHGLRLEVLEPVASWLPVDPRWAPARFDLDTISRYAEELGVASLCALAGGNIDLSVDEVADRYADVCRRFARIGVRACIEPIPMSGIRNLTEAKVLVDRADRGTAGVIFDTWHFYRGNGDVDALVALGGDDVSYVQVSDAATEIQGSLARDTYHRLLPGEGTFRLESIVAVLRGLGALGMSGPEVITPAFAQRGLSCLEAARLVTDATERFLASA